MKYLLIIFFLSIACSGFGQGVAGNLGSGKAAGLNGINTVFDDAYALSGNQAGLAWTDRFGAVGYAEQRFLIEGLAGLSAGALLPTSGGNFGATLSYLGLETYSEQKVGLAYARKILKNLSFGAQFDFFNQQTANFGSISAYTFELGFQLKVRDNLLVGVHTLNPINTKLESNDELTSNFKLGIAYSPIRTATIFAEAEADVLQSLPIFRGGLTYELTERLEARIGVRSNPSSFSFGAAYFFKGGFGFDLAAVYHDVLGFTPSAGFVYRGEGE